METADSFKNLISLIPVKEEWNPMKNPVFLKTKEPVNLTNEKELAFSIDDLGLELVSIKRCRSP